MDQVRGVEPNRATVRICDDDGELNNVCTFMFHLWSLYTRAQCMTDIVEVRLCGEAFGLYASPITIVICSEVIASSYCILYRETGMIPSSAMMLACCYRLCELSCFALFLAAISGRDFLFMHRWNHAPLPHGYREPT